MACRRPGLTVGYALTAKNSREVRFTRMTRMKTVTAGYCILIGFLRDSLERQHDQQLRYRAVSASFRVIRVKTNFL
jgi:hypothetical protein